MPGIANPAYGEFDPINASFTGTFNFEYTADQSEQLMGLIEFTVIEHKELFKQAFLKVIERKPLREKKKRWLFSFFRN